MTAYRVSSVWFALPACVLMCSASAFAQSGSGIAGVVKDSSGAVLPGVTVEAASPALIEKVRTSVTDGEGQYKLLNLRPGVYTVTFTLAGFNTVRREGIELTASFTATVNADLRVGALEETITVSGQAPTVDVQNVVQQRVITRDIMDALPVGTKSVVAVGLLIPGVMPANQQDVGGATRGSPSMAIHGGRVGEQQLLFDGMYYNNAKGVGGVQTIFAPNDATIQEIALEVSGTSAESWMGGIRSNIIPKDGGNTFIGTFFGTYGSIQSKNLSDDYFAQGLTSADQLIRIYDFNPAYGGPFKKDKLWFFVSPRIWSVSYNIGGVYYNKSPLPYIYEPDLSRPAVQRDIDSNISLRLTWQVASKHKVSIHPQHNTSHRNGNYNGSRTSAPEAVSSYVAHPSDYVMVTWNSPLTNRVLLEGGVSFGTKDPQTRLQEGVSENTPSYRELSTNFTWNNNSGIPQNMASHQYTYKFAASYVTGSHAAKFGVNLQHGAEWYYLHVVNNSTTLALLNGVPRQVTVYSYPFELTEAQKYNVGLFAQDQWTVKRLTLNLGVRYDKLENYVPPQHAGPSYWLPTRNVDFARVDNVPNWSDVTPRFGVAYDLFVTGKTAVKASLNRYLESPDMSTFTRRANPLNSTAVSANRTWTDLNGDYLPQENELGAPSNASFGNSVLTLAVNDEVNRIRGYNWEGSASLQHELRPQLSATAAYFRRWYGNVTTTQNTAVSAADFNSYCVTAPVDARLPGGGGYQVCGFSEVTQAKFGQTRNVVSMASHFGKQEEVYDGLDLNMSWRLAGGTAVAGGASIGRVRTNNCFALNDPSLVFAGTATGVTAPRTSPYCDIRPPFAPNVKFLFVYPLPVWGLQTSATYQGLPGQPITATRVYTSAEIAPSLGRNLSSGANGTVTLDLIPPATLYGGRLNQIDIRVMKVIQMGSRRRIQVQADIYNLFNSDWVQSFNTVYGPTYHRPLSILPGRLVKFGTQITF